MGDGGNNMKKVRLIMDTRAKEDKGAMAYSRALIRAFEAVGIECMVSSQSPQMLMNDQKPYILIEPSNFTDVKNKYSLDVDSTAVALTNNAIAYAKTHEVKRVHVIGKGKVGGIVYNRLLQSKDVSVTMTSSKDHPDDVVDCIKAADLVISCAPYNKQLPYDVSGKIVLDAGKNFKSFSFDDLTRYYISSGSIGVISIMGIIKKYEELYDVDAKANT